MRCLCWYCRLVIIRDDTAGENASVCCVTNVADKAMARATIRSVGQGRRVMCVMFVRPDVRVSFFVALFGIRTVLRSVEILLRIANQRSKNQDTKLFPLL